MSTHASENNGHRPGCRKCVTCSRHSARQALAEYNQLHAAGTLHFFLVNTQRAPAVVPLEEWVAPKVRPGYRRARTPFLSLCKAPHAPRPSSPQATNALWDRRAPRGLLRQLTIPTTRSLKGECVFAGVVLVTSRGDRLECEDASDLAAGLGVDDAEAAREWRTYAGQP